MTGSNSTERRSSFLWWSLVTLVAAMGALALAAVLTPQAWLEVAAGRAGHSDELTSDRVARLRWIGLALAAAHLFWLAWLSTRGRTASTNFLVRAAAESRSMQPIGGLRRAGAWFVEPGWFHSGTFLLVVAIAVWLRLTYIHTPMDYDEAYSFLNYANRPLYQGLADYSSTNNHLLNTLLMHTASRMFGPHEWALRLHTVFAGIGVVAMTYIMGRRLVAPDVGLLAAAFAATSYLLVNYSVNARGYIWVAWMTTLLMMAFWSVEKSAAVSSWDLIGAACAAVLGLFAMPIMVGAIGGCVIWYGAPGRVAGEPWSIRRPRLALWGLAVGCAALWLYSPAIVFRGTLAWQHVFVAPLPPVEWLQRVPDACLLAVRGWADGPVPWLVSAGLSGIGLFGLWLFARDAIWLVLSIPLATLTLMILQRVAPPPRVLSFMAPLFAICVATGAYAIIKLIALPERASMAAKSERTVRALCCWIACGVCLWGAVISRDHALPGGLRPVFLIEHAQRIWSEDANRKTDRSTQLWRLDVPDAVRIVESELQPGDRVLVGLPADLPFHFYAARRGWTAPIGGQPQPGERVFLVLRAAERPVEALRKNLSLQFNDPGLIGANWQTVALGELVIWLAELPAQAPSDATSP